MRIIIVVIGFFCLITCKAQSLDNETKKFLSKNQKLSNTIIYHDTISDTKKYRLIKFGILGSHELPYLIIENINKKTCKIIHNYLIKQLLNETNIFLEDLSESHRIGLIQNILDISNSHNKMDGWELIE